jgi:drug/metabolite transporter (DMT)-like permease
MNFLPMLLTGVTMIAAGFLAEDFLILKFDVNAVISVFYLAFFGSVVTFTSYYWLMKRMNVVLLSLIAFITPVVALIVGWIAYNEQLYERYIWGSTLVLSGILISNGGSLLKYLKFRNPKISG